MGLNIAIHTTTMQTGSWDRLYSLLRRAENNSRAAC